MKRYHSQPSSALFRRYFEPNRKSTSTALELHISDSLPPPERRSDSTTGGPRFSNSEFGTAGSNTGGASGARGPSTPARDVAESRPSKSRPQAPSEVTQSKPAQRLTTGAGGAVLPSTSSL